MKQILLKIRPEEELFNHLRDSTEIKSFCSGERGLLIYSSKKEIESDTLTLDFHVESNEKIKEYKSTKSEKILTFACNCLNNPPSKLREIIQNLDGIILDPVKIKQNWEYLNIVFQNDDTINDFKRELKENYYSNFQIKYLEQKEETDSFNLLLKKNFEELTRLITDNQQEKIINAWKKGYYKIPRQISTKNLAKEEEISRYAFEKNLRIAENKIMDKLISILLLYKSKSN